MLFAALCAALMLSTAACTGDRGSTADFICIETAAGLTITGYKGRAKVITIPAQINGKPVTAIGYDAFFNKQLTGVTIDAGLVIIEESAFSSNPLTSVTLPDTLTAIGDYAFDIFNSLRDAYNAAGAGTYIRPNTNSTTWTKK